MFVFHDLLGDESLGSVFLAVILTCLKNEQSEYDDQTIT